MKNYRNSVEKMFSFDIFLIEFSPLVIRLFLTLFLPWSRRNSESNCCYASSTPLMTSLKYGEQGMSIGLLSRLHNIYRGVECLARQQSELSALKKQTEENYCFAHGKRAFGQIFIPVRSLFMAWDAVARETRLQTQTKIISKWGKDVNRLLDENRIN